MHVLWYVYNVFSILYYNSGDALGETMSYCLTIIHIEIIINTLE